MNRYLSMFARALLALAVSSSAALAAPVYHVDLDTSAWSGQGFLDFAVVGSPGAPLARASVSHLGGAFGPEAERVGAVQGALPAGFSLESQAGDNYLTQAIDFGGIFSFDIAFDGDYQTVEGSDGATFVIGLFDALMKEYTPAASFAAQPALAGIPAALVASADAPFASISPGASAVPEPAQLALLAIAVIAAMAARRRTS